MSYWAHFNPIDLLWNVFDVRFYWESQSCVLGTFYTKQNSRVFAHFFFSLFFIFRCRFRTKVSYFLIVYLFILEIRVNVFKFLDFHHQVKKWFETKMTIITRIHISAKNGIRKAIGYIEIWSTFEWCILCTAQCPFHNIHSTISTPQYPFQLFLCLNSYVWILLDHGSSYPFHFRSSFDTEIGITNR